MFNRTDRPGRMQKSHQTHFYLVRRVYKEKEML